MPRLLAVVVLWVAAGQAAFADRPNVLFVVVDDLNDWVGCLGGHPQVATPHIDRLASRGMLFSNAHCSASLCNPSRASVLTGTLPSSNGVHGNEQDWRKSPYLAGHETLPEYFRKRGYWTAAGGKIFHANHGGECGALQGGHGGLQGFDQPAAWTERFPSHEQQLPKLPVPTGRNFNGLDIWHWDWGAIDVPETATEDGQVADWAAATLGRLGRPEPDTAARAPWFLAVGLYAPHGPWYCPPDYFEQYPLPALQLPALNPADDLDDVPAIAKRHLGSASGDYHARVTGNGLYLQAVQAYLAQIAFADARLGEVLAALDQTGQADNTVIVLWSDHGWHLGEKQKWHKGTNWEEGTRVPLIIVAPGVAKPGSVCSAPVSLVDLYPTLLDLCALPAYERLDGDSLVPWLQDPAAPRDKPAYTINGGRHQSVRSERWRYIRYGDGSEELYDHESDPTEYRNLADNAEFDDIKRQLSAHFPPEIQQADDGNDRTEAGFRPIFNGYDLTSWDGDPGLWRVEDGAIVGETTEDGQLPHNTFLIWRGSQPANFELRLKFRVLGDNNSGVQYRSQERPNAGTWVLSGYQADMHPRADLLGMIYEEQGRTILATSGERVVVMPDGRRMLTGRTTAQEVPDSADAPLVDLTKWRELSVIASGNHLVHKLDGVTVAEMWDHDEPHRALRGLIGLQLHAGNRVRCEFQDLRLRDLPPAELTGVAETPLADDATEVHGPERGSGGVSPRSGGAEEDAHAAGCADPGDHLGRSRLRGGIAGRWDRALYRGAGSSRGSHTRVPWRAVAVATRTGAGRRHGDDAGARDRGAFGHGARSRA